MVAYLSVMLTNQVARLLYAASNAHPLQVYKITIRRLHRCPSPRYHRQNSGSMTCRHPKRPPRHPVIVSGCHCARPCARCTSVAGRIDVLHFMSEGIVNKTRPKRFTSSLYIMPQFSELLVTVNGYLRRRQFARVVNPSLYLVHVIHRRKLIVVGRYTRVCENTITKRFLKCGVYSLSKSHEVFTINNLSRISNLLPYPRYEHTYQAIQGSSLYVCFLAVPVPGAYTNRHKQDGTHAPRRKNSL